MQSITLRFLASQSTLPQAGRVPGGTVLRWVDEAGFACASAWAKGPCITEFVGGAHFVHPIRPGDLVEVHARLASTTDTAMHLAVEVRSGGIHGEPLQEVLHCVAVYTAVDADEQPRAIDKWSPETPGDMALAQRVKAHIDAARAAQ
ncbi:acyl-CoA hydrolase [Acidovorax sp. 93]|jgi:acyl-CoA hydrolase|uniref:Acyl-CoA thioesterase n=1 Tax=Acidovorax facilis TaxID=12917 RepID=A0ABV8DA65_9BURK|nr:MULTISPECIES: hotdog domain-containing protein [Acidovorax]OGA80718.1 MAG: acyl-CoA thioesterase [Burkholderiales bacterium GWA2_64_37]OGB07285.1 MAG: acyl-CoA thioesterase [Burkholderiales bacterium RIFCSPHIGHO2_02_FULL_64_19]OGB17447.1 MAG: acyl-CoA thioesterase [Burkholderiales bacterium RIFCSPHIGHO2_12_FULL_65_48]OGB56791.1 MAG: acyl-CoA thioesterase [Burkholderiales bacterium RIFCSPLOWO2_12_FULL_64_33]HCE91282.1 acyl-CoA thioesterase [Acidovorax sp.]